MHGALVDYCGILHAMVFGYFLNVNKDPFGFECKCEQTKQCMLVVVTGVVVAGVDDAQELFD